MLLLSKSNPSSSLLETDTDTYAYVKVTVDEETQMERLKKTYSDWEIHWENRNNPSEKEVDMIDLSIITCHIGAEDTLNFETEWLK